MVIAVARTMKKARNSQCSATNMAQFDNVTHTILTDNTLILSGIDLFVTKFEIYGPNLGCAINQSYHCLLPLRNNAAVSNRRGVVGSTGRKIPNTANPSDINPNIVSMILVISSGIKEHKDIEKIDYLCRIG